MLWIGLTGGIASGKSTVAQILREMGEPVVDADLLAREAIAPGTDGFQQVVHTFGQAVLSQDQSLDRKKLGALVFSQPDALEKLEQIIHPRVRRLSHEKRLQLERQGYQRAFYDVPLLFEKNLHDQFDLVVLVYSPIEKQRERLRSRDQLAEIEIERRLKAQIDIEEKKRRTSLIIDNSKGPAELRLNVSEMIKNLPSPNATDGHHKR